MPLFRSSVEQSTQWIYLIVKPVEIVSVGSSPFAYVVLYKIFVFVLCSLVLVCFIVNKFISR